MSWINPLLASRFAMLFFPFTPIRPLALTGLRLFFIRKFRMLLVRILLRFALIFSTVGLPWKRSNHNHLVLTPKCKNPWKAGKYRLISVCNVSYLIISKVLANKLKRVLDDIISPAQRTFVPGRLISENFLIEFECLHAIHDKRRGKIGITALKLNMSQAYYRIEWP